AWDAGLHGRISDLTRAVLIADASSVATELESRLEAEGIQARHIPFTPGASFDDLLADVTLDRRTLIIFVASLHRHTLTNAPPEAGWAGLAACPWIPALLQLAQTLHRRQGVPRLVVVTNGAAGVAG